MQITGELLIGGSSIRGKHGTMRALDVASGKEIDPAFTLGGEEEVQRAAALAEAAFDPYRLAPLETRARFLETIAKGIEDLGDTLIERAQIESALPRARLEGERARTTGQLRLFASLVRDGRWLSATIDTAMPERKPMPRSDLRLQRIAVGPVAVFGASNFPLAFSVAGGDTASALAAGCPVIVKAHSAHPGTSELVGRVIQKAVADMGLPEGVFSLLFGPGNRIGEALVRHPAISAVGFTGSRRGGLSLMKTASERPVPIPVYAEMSSINPFYLLPGALKSRAQAIAQGFADSVTLGVGQFCTNPGLVIALDGPELDAFLAAVRTALAAKNAQTMLTPGIHAAYADGVASRRKMPVVEIVAEGGSSEAPSAAQPVLFGTTAEAFLGTPELEGEIFGPTSLIVRCRDEEELMRVTREAEGQLTATLHFDESDVPLARKLLPLLERRVGRILGNGYPTGVEVSYAMVHGGPFPATSDGRTSSVGATAIERFLRPVCYQDLPDTLLPEALREGNPLGLWRLRDGQLGKD
jgi:alpha-ketoglutaric semialdehyde dehydrogenase